MGPEHPNRAAEADAVVRSPTTVPALHASNRRDQARGGQDRTDQDRSSLRRTHQRYQGEGAILLERVLRRAQHPMRGFLHLHVHRVYHSHHHIRRVARRRDQRLYRMFTHVHLQFNPSQNEAIV